MDVPRLASSFHSIGTSHCSDVPFPGAAQEVLQSPLRGLGHSGDYPKVPLKSQVEAQAKATHS